MGTSFQIVTTDVKFSGGVLSIRGLSLSDIGPLVSKYLSQIVAVYMGVIAGGREPSLDLISESLLLSAPDLAAELIAHAADAPDRVYDIKRLNIAVQLEALQAVGTRTFESEDSLKKVMEMVLSGLEQASKAVDQARVQAIKSSIGSMVSEETSVS